MKQNIHDQFLELYKKVEAAIPKMKNAPLDANIRWLEDQIIDQEKRNKLYVCRITRNYIQHNTDFQSFINISSGMLSFLKDIYLEVIANQVKNEDIMITGKQFIIANIHDNIIDTIKKMESKRQDYVPILKDDKVIGIFSDKIVRQMMIKNGNCEKTFDKIQKLLKIPTNVKFVKAEDSIEKTLEMIKDGCIVFCTDNGKNIGKIEGMIKDIKNYVR